MTSSHKPVKVKATLRNLTIAIMKMAGQSQHCRRLPPPHPGRHPDPGYPGLSPACPKRTLRHYAVALTIAAPGKRLVRDKSAELPAHENGQLNHPDVEERRKEGFEAQTSSQHPAFTQEIKSCHASRLRPSISAARRQS